MEKQKENEENCDTYMISNKIHGKSKKSIKKIFCRIE